MEKMVLAFFQALQESGVGVTVVSISAIIVAGMSVYGMIVALKRRS